MDVKMLLFYRTRNFSSFSPSTLALSPITGSFRIYKFWLVFLPQILLIKFQSISWRTSLHYLHPWRLEELHDLQVNNEQFVKLSKKYFENLTHTSFSVPLPRWSSYSFFCLRWASQQYSIWSILQPAMHYILKKKNMRPWWYRFRDFCLPCLHPLCLGHK